MKKEIKLTILGALLGVFFTAIYDYIKEVPILSTIKTFLNYLWVNVFEIEIKIWKILFFIILILLINKFFKKNRIKNKEENSLDWLGYTQDLIGEVSWKWYWEYNNLFSNYEIKNLRPICPECETSMKLHLNRLEEFANCPRCDNEILEFKNPEKVKSIIRDNVQRDLYKNKLNDKK